MGVFNVGSLGIPRDPFPCGAGQNAMQNEDCRRVLYDALYNRNNGEAGKAVFDKFRNAWREHCSIGDNFDSEQTPACREFCLQTDELGKPACNLGFDNACPEARFVQPPNEKKNTCFEYLAKANPQALSSKLRQKCSASGGPTGECFGSDSYVCDRISDARKPGEKGNRFEWCNEDLVRLCAASQYQSPLCKCLAPGARLGQRDMFCRSTLTSCRNQGYVLNPSSPCPDVCVNVNAQVGAGGRLEIENSNSASTRQTTVTCSNSAAAQSATVTTPGPNGKIEDWSAWWVSGQWLDLASSGYTVGDAVQECAMAIRNTKPDPITDTAYSQPTARRVLKQALECGNRLTNAKLPVWHPVSLPNFFFSLINAPDDRTTIQGVIDAQKLFLTNLADQAGRAARGPTYIRDWDRIRAALPPPPIPPAPAPTPPPPIPPQPEPSAPPQPGPSGPEGSPLQPGPAPDSEPPQSPPLGPSLEPSGVAVPREILVAAVVAIVVLILAGFGALKAVL